MQKPFFRNSPAVNEMQNCDPYYQSPCGLEREHNKNKCLNACWGKKGNLPRVNKIVPCCTECLELELELEIELERLVSLCSNWR